MRRSRLIAFLRRWPEVVRTSTWRARRAAPRGPCGSMMSRTASAPMPAPEHAAAAGARAVLLVERTELGLAEGHHRLERLDLVARACGSRPCGPGPRWRALALGLERRRPIAALQVGDLLLGRALPRRARAAGAPRSTRSVSAATILRSRAVASRAALLAGGDDDLAGRRERDRALGDAGPERLRGAPRPPGRQ